MRFVQISFAIILFATGKTFAQTGFSLGYNLARFATPQRNFEVMEYEYRNLIPGFDVPQNLFGASLGFRYGTENFLGEVLFTNKRNTTTNYQYAGSDGYTYEFELKNRLRTLNLGMAAGIEIIKIGASLDIGMYKIFSKNGLASADNKWNNYYERHELFTGATFFIPVKLLVFEIRPFYQVGFFYERFNGGVKDYTHRSSNFGINLSLVLAGEY